MLLKSTFWFSLKCHPELSEWQPIPFSLFTDVGHKNDGPICRQNLHHFASHTVLLLPRTQHTLYEIESTPHQTIPHACDKLLSMGLGGALGLANSVLRWGL
eukprot:2271777-Amphidinium_carterae.1